MKQKDTITFEDFEKIDIRVGTILQACVFEKANKPAYQLYIDFGEPIGIKKSSAQITDLYNTTELVGKQIVAVINFKPKQIANFISECLVLGVMGSNKQVTLISPTFPVTNGDCIA